MTKYNKPCAKKIPRKTRWDDNEISLLKKYYPLEGSKVSTRLKGRTPKAVRSKAERLKLRMIKRQSKRWTDDEIILMKKYYSKKGPIGLSIMLDRTVSSVTGKAYQLKIQCASSSKWSEDEIEFLKNNYGKLGALICSFYLPGRTIKAIYQVAYNLKITSTYR